MNTFETLDHSTSSNAAFSEEHMNAFRESAKYMKIYSIIIFVIVGLASLLMLVFFAMGPERLFDEISRQNGVDTEAFDILINELKIVIYLLPFFLIALIYGCYRLLQSANSLIALTFSKETNDFRLAISNMRMYWMITGIVTIVAIVLGLYLGGKIVTMR